MTTYQDPPLHSRRAARQGERAQADGAQRDASSRLATDPAAPPEPLSYATTSRPPLPQYDGQSLRPRRTAEPVDPDAADRESEPVAGAEAGGYRQRDFSPEGRRAASRWAPQYGGVGTDGTVEFQTQARDQVPSMIPSASTDTASTDTVPRATALPIDVPSPAEHTMTRRELRALREAGLIPDEWAPSAATASSPVVAPAPVEPIRDAPIAAAWPTPEAGAAVTPLAEPIPLVPPAPQPSTRLDSALAEFDALAVGREPLIPAPDAPVPLPGRRAAAPIIEPMPTAEAMSGTETVSGTAAEASRDDNPVPPASSPIVAAMPPATPVPPVTPALVTEPEPEEHAEAEPSGLSAFDALFQPPSVAVPVVAAPPDELFAFPVPDDRSTDEVVEAEIVQPEPEAGSVASGAPVPTADSAITDSGAEPGVGHWTTQAGIDDAEQVNDTTISRSVGAGSGAITTSALVLPSIPEHSIGGALGESGQIMLTGSISLPESLAATGAHPSQLDESDIDHLLDPGDHQVASTDSTPVRAIRAVSTHTASGGIIAPTKPKGTRGFTVLIIAASAMAVVVVGLLVAGLASGTL